MNIPDYKFFVSFERAFLTHRATSDFPGAKCVAVETGVEGFFPIYANTEADNNPTIPDDVLDSAVAASMFGWHTPAAKLALDFAKRRQERI